MNKPWVLTEEHNDYNQHGEVFVYAWNHRPTFEEIRLKVFNDEIANALHIYEVYREYEIKYLLYEVGK